MSNNLVSMNNLLDILSPIKTNIVSKINDKDINEHQKEKLNKTNIIDTTTNSSGFLSDSGKYNNINIDNMNDSINKTNNVYDIFKIKENEYKYTSGANMPINNYYLSSCIYKNIIHVIGGESEDYRILNNHNIYDIETNTWSVSKPIPTARMKLTISICDKKIYCIGGENKTDLIKNIEVYDIETNTWSTSISIPSVRTNLSSCVYNNKIYCIGGDSNSNFLDIIEIYDIENNTWTTNNSNMPYKKKFISSIIYKDKLYIIGGNTENGYSNTIDVYDIKLNKWDSIIMPISRYNTTCQLYNDSIYIIYGFGKKSNDFYCSIEEYNILKNKWTTIKINSSIIDSLTSCIYNNKIYIIGGFCGKARNNLDILSLSYIDYDISLPSNIQNKLDCISDIGLGTKILSNKGEYIDIPKGYRFMESNEVIDFIKILDGI